MLSGDPHWYKDAVIYELHVRSFHDRIGDGMGDFRGLRDKLDYLQDLGVTAIWLLPFYPSPLKDDGYDIADYGDIHPHYGNLHDFRAFLDAAHERGLRVITELVINHTSDQHPWFRRARRAPPGSPERDFYVWSDSPEKYREARIIFKDFEHSNWTWDPVAKSYFWHRFYSHQPDLNYDNPAVWQAIFPVVDFWLGMGVDGMRLDAVPYLYEREGTNCENLPETHEFLKALRRHVDERYPNRMLLGEANQWPEDAVAYFGSGDEVHMAFHFPVMPRMFMAVHQEDRFPIIDIMEQTPAIHENCQWAMFLRNHDELTLEMVTDEERDYMYRAYAHDPRARVNLGIRRRLSPLLGNNRRRIELMNALLFSLPGAPVIYYGDEIGMGDNIYLGDRNGVRTPMQWSSDRNAGFSRANPQKLFLPVIIDPEYHYEAVNVEAQQSNPSSILWWMKRLIALRKQHLAFSRGTLEFLKPENRKILAFLRRHKHECLLVVANLSRFVQYVELDLAEFQGVAPVELFGRNAFPPIGKSPYMLTLSPHAFYWFALQQLGATEFDVEQGESGPAVVPIWSNWEELFRSSGLERLNRVLPDYLCKRHWYRSRSRVLKAAAVRELFRVPYGDSSAYVTLVEAEFTEGEPETYLVPLSCACGDRARELLKQMPDAVVARLSGAAEGVLYDVLAEPRFCSAVLEAIRDGLAFEAASDAEIQAYSLDPFQQIYESSPAPLVPTIARGEQSNTSIMYSGRMILKVFRRIEQGINPDLEIGRFLMQGSGRLLCAPVIGAIEYRRRLAESITLAVLHGFVPNEGDAWQFTLDALSSYFEQVVAMRVEAGGPPGVQGSIARVAELEPPALARELIGSYLDSAQLLGQRTAEMHWKLASVTEPASFAPEPFSLLYQRSIYQSVRSQAGRVLDLLSRRLHGLHGKVQDEARHVLELRHEIGRRFHSLLEHKVQAMRIRCHGDFHLGQVLYTGKDFVIIDFEGEANRPISDRRIKRSSLRDVAGMIRSFNYATYNTLLGRGNGRGHSPGHVRPEDVNTLEPWASYWYTWVAATYLRAYRATAAHAAFLPQSDIEFRIVLDAFLLDQAIYELAYELDNRPDWVQIPLKGILQLLEPADKPTEPIGPLLA